MDPLKRLTTKELMENENIKRLIETQEQRLNDQNQKRYADIFELPTGQHVYNDFDIFDELNGGYFGRVLLVRLKNSGQIYLMKRLPYMKQDDKHKADDEIVVLKQLQSKYTVRLFEAFPFDIDICLIEEYYQKGDMRRKIYEIQKLSNEERIKICLKFMYQILMGVNMLHSKNIIHRDIKPENIYIDNNGNAILGDFGLAKNIGSHSYVKVAGTELYTAPEAFLQDKMFLESDIFSAGITFFEMLTGNHPFKKDEYENFETTLKKIKNGQSDQLPDWVPVDLKRIVMNMIHVDYERRPSAEQILNSNLMKIQVEIENANQ
ncbi:MAG: putative serine/threonine-protein kinase Nek3 [Streblomastix strix]|uniref:non-specific serine/threonine protein kinase n=1 Tax=Streblomastix strix TaxID=222440 RepID=A0A5J4UZJ1_9EUKA|nr:MAG: putative serine/threonine-protein kinase Nek3 [Streblomastix strix]